MFVFLDIHTFGLVSVLATCDVAIKRAIRSRNPRTCQEMDDLFDDAIRALEEYGATFHQR